jgi:hypothetical protein
MMKVSTLRLFFGSRSVSVLQLLIPFTVVCYFAFKHIYHSKITPITLSGSGLDLFYVTFLSLFLLIIEGFRLRILFTNITLFTGLRMAAYGQTCSFIGPTWIMDILGKGIILKDVPFQELISAGFWTKATQWISALIFGFFGLNILIHLRVIEVDFKVVWCFLLFLFILLFALIYIGRRYRIKEIARKYLFGIVLQLSHKSMAFLILWSMLKTGIIVLQYIVVSSFCCVSPPSALMISAAISVTFLIRSFLPSLGWLIDYFSRYAIASGLLLCIGISETESLLLTSIVMIFNQLVPILLSILIEFFEVFKHRHTSLWG